MSLWKTVAGIIIIVVGGVFALIAVHQRGLKTPLQQELAPAQGNRETLTGAPVASAPPTAATSDSSGNGTIALANDPRRAASPVALANAAQVDAETAKRYTAALEDLELDGCNANGTFAILMRNERRPRIVRNGQTVQFANGLNLTIRQKGYPACRVVLYDGKLAIGEVAGF